MSDRGTADLQCKLISHGTRTYREAVQLRREVLRLPLGLDFSRQELFHESDQIHFVAQIGFRVVATLLLAPVLLEDGIVSRSEIKMRQVAVAPELQGKSIGSQLVVFAEGWAKQNHFRKMVLHARENAVPFYERLGYTLEGPPFLEVGLTHFLMVKRF